MSKQSTFDYLIKPITVSTVYAGFGYYKYGNKNAFIPFTSIAAPIPLLLAGSAFVASFLSNTVRQFVMPHIPQNGWMASVESTALEVGTTSAITGFLISQAADDIHKHMSLGQVMFISGIIDLAAQQIFTSFVDPIY